MWVWDTLSPVCVLHFHSTLDREFINMVNASKCVVTHTHKRRLSYLFWTLKKLVGIWEEDGGKHSSLMEWHENVLRGFRAHNVFGKPQIMGFAQAQGLLHGEAGDHIGKSGGPILNPLTGWPKSHRGRGAEQWWDQGQSSFQLRDGLTDRQDAGEERRRSWRVPAILGVKRPVALLILGTKEKKAQN